jgi:tetratricopeptide (TPR) repeat protein
MTVGLYQYIVGSIPWYLKWLAAIAGYRGTKDEGFRQLNVAVSKGNYVKVDAKILQMVLLMREGRPKEALQDARELHRDYPRNFIFQINIAQILEKLGETDQAAAEYLDVVRRAEQAMPNYQLVAMSTFRYAVGYKLLELGRAESARQQLEKSIADPSTPERERVLSQLRLGQALDVEGKREQAVERYQAVMKMKNVEDSQSLARRYLRKPYRR